MYIVGRTCSVFITQFEVAFNETSQTWESMGNLFSKMLRRSKMRTMFGNIELKKRGGIPGKKLEFGISLINSVCLTADLRGIEVFLYLKVNSVSRQ